MYVPHSHVHSCIEVQCRATLESPTHTIQNKELITLTSAHNVMHACMHAINWYSHTSYILLQYYGTCTQMQRHVQSTSRMMYMYAGKQPITGKPWNSVFWMHAHCYSTHGDKYLASWLISSLILRPFLSLYTCKYRCACRHKGELVKVVSDNRWVIRLPFLHVTNNIKFCTFIHRGEWYDTWNKHSDRHIRRIYDYYSMSTANTCICVGTWMNYRAHQLLKQLLARPHTWHLPLVTCCTQKHN